MLREYRIARQVMQRTLPTPSRTCPRPARAVLLHCVLRAVAASVSIGHSRRCRPVVRQIRQRRPHGCPQAVQIQPERLRTHRGGRWGKAGVLTLASGSRRPSTRRSSTVSTEHHTVGPEQFDPGLRGPVPWIGRAPARRFRMSRGRQRRPYPEAAPVRRRTESFRGDPVVSKRTFQPNNRRRAKYPRLPAAYAHPGWPSHPRRQTRQGPGQAVRLSAGSSTIVMVLPCFPERTAYVDGVDFSTAIRSGRRCARSTLVVHYHVCEPHDPSAPPRAGFVVSRAVGNAVTRNAVRRRLRELVRHELPETSGRIAARRPRAPRCRVRAYRAACGRPDHCAGPGAGIRSGAMMVRLVVLLIRAYQVTIASAAPRPDLQHAAVPLLPQL